MYSKVFARIAESSLMEEPISVRYTFLMLIAISDPEGYVIGTDVAVARRLNMTVDEFKSCVKVLMSPDPNSNSKEQDGRRVVESELERGYLIVNYLKYKNMKSESERREYMREYMKKYRSKPDVNSGKQRKRKLTHAEEEEEEKGEETSNASSMLGASPPPFVEIPTEKEWLAACERRLIPEWYALKHFHRYNEIGWMKGTTPVRWESAVMTVNQMFNNDGRPSKPKVPNGKPSGPAPIPWEEANRMMGGE